MKPSESGRSAYTMIEILIAVSLSMILMLAVAKLFQGVGTAMNDTQAAMIMGRNLNNVRFQLELDLACRTISTVEPCPPAGTDGYFSYTEGPMWEPSDGDPRLLHINSQNNEFDQDLCNMYAPWCSRNIAKNAKDGASDNTVGDLDDILALTVDYGKNNKDLSIRGKVLSIEQHGSTRMVTVESQEAEVVWFVRGNTLYRRILLIGDVGQPTRVPHGLTDWLRRNRTNLGNNTAVCTMGDYRVEIDKNVFNKFYPMEGNDNSDMTGEGFWAFFDISTRLEPVQSGGNVSVNLVANRTSDLARREHRYGNWRNPRILANELFSTKPSSGGYGNNNLETQYPDRAFPFNPHDFRNNSGCSWYLLGMPTLRETSRSSWRAGCASPSLGNIAHVSSGMTANDFVFRTSTATVFDYWGNARDPNGPNCWDAQIDTTNGIGRDTTLANYRGPRYTEDVVLTNVIAFDIKAWDESISRFVDLGEGGKSDNSSNSQQYDSAVSRNGLNRAAGTFPLRSRGAYANNAEWLTNTGTANPDAVITGNNPFRWNNGLSGNTNPELACVYDTWTQEYERDDAPNRFTYNIPTGYSRSFPSDSTAWDSHLSGTKSNWACPPPYGDTTLPGIQITIRTFDPRSGHIREVKQVTSLK